MLSLCEYVFILLVWPFAIQILKQDQREMTHHDLAPQTARINLLVDHSFKTLKLKANFLFLWNKVSQVSKYKKSEMLAINVSKYELEKH